VLKNILRRIKFYKFNYLLIGFCSVICISGFNSILFLREIVEKSVQSQSRQILAADLSVSVRRQLTQVELSKINSLLDQNQQQTILQTEFFGMVESEKEIRLVQIKAVNEKYPLYGQLLNAESKKIEFVIPEPNASYAEGVFSQSALNQLNIKAGDFIKAGQLKIKVSQVIGKDTTQSIRFSSFAPKIYIHSDWLPKTDLLKASSTLNQALLIRNNNKELKTADLKEKFLNEFPDPAVRIESDLDEAQDSARALQYLLDYLGLITVIGLSIAVFGIGIIVRSLFQSKFKEITLQQILGKSLRSCVAEFAIELLLMILIFSTLSLFLSYSIANQLLPFLSQFLFVDFVISLKISYFFQVLIVFLFIFTFISIPYFRLFFKSQLLSIWNNRFTTDEKSLTSGWKYFLAFFVFLFAAAFYICKSLVLSAILASSLLAQSFLLYFFVRFLFKILLSSRFKSSFVLQQSIKLIRHDFASYFIIMVVISIGAGLMTTLPTIRTTLEQEIKAPKGLALPSAFLFDIQDEQKDKLLIELKQKEVSIDAFSPMIRARITKINNNTFEREIETSVRTREDERQQRLRNRSVNLSFRDKLTDDEDVVAGKFANEQIDLDTASLSIESEYAERIKVKLGDIIYFDLQGVEIKGKVTSLRKVRWSSFKPNFFILISSSFVQDAPKTYLGILTDNQKEKLPEVLKVLAKNFPNVSLINVNEFMKALFDLLSSFETILIWSAYYVLLVSFLILIAIFIVHSDSDKRFVIVAKALGTSQKKVQQIFLVETGFFLSLSVLFGAFAGIAIAWLINKYTIKASFSVPFAEVFTVFILLSTLGMIVRFAFVKKASYQKLNAIYKEL